MEKSDKTGKSLFDQRSGDFYDPWETTPEERRRRTIRKRLLEYVDYAREHVPFYAERLADVDRKGDHPLKKIKPMTSAELREHLPPLSRDLVARAGSDYTVFQSGGTTGMPKSTLFSHDELEGLNLPNARGFYALGLNKEDRVADLFAVGGLYMTFVHINRMLQQYGCMNFPFSNHTPPDFIHTVTKLFNVNSFAGISSVVLGALRRMAEIGLDGIHVEKIFYGGEHLYEADKAELRERFGVKMIGAPGYGTVETWYIGYQCLECGTGVFHAHDDQCYIEIVDPETGEHVAPGEVGSLYATPMPRRLMPNVRYAVGDRAKWLPKPCPCGRTTPLFKLLGRGDDVLRIGFDSVDYNYVQECAAKNGRVSGTIQMEKRRLEGRDLLVVRIETDAPAGAYDEIGKALAAAIAEGRPSLRDEVAKGTVWPVKVELLATGQLPRNPRTGKLIRIIDAIKDED